MGFFKRLLRPGGKKAAGRRRRSRRILHLPHDLRDPEAILIFSGPEESDVWPALYLTNSLQKHYRNTAIRILAPKRDREMFTMLDSCPEVHVYQGKPSVPEDLKNSVSMETMILAYPYDRVIDSDSRFLAEIDCEIRMAPLNEPSPLLNLVARTGSDHFPEKLAQMCSAFHIEYDHRWKPHVPEHIRKDAEKLMAPVSGRLLPYIVTTGPAAAILERSRAEIPLRTVCLKGKKPDLQELSREMRSAVVAGAAAVATDSDDIWGDACAFEVPVAGLDRTGTFLKWHGIEAAGDEAAFVESWVGILKNGW